MARAFDEGRKCFTFVWTIENVDHWWNKNENLQSPIFKVDEMEGTQWRLMLYNDNIFNRAMRLIRVDGEEGPKRVELDWELSLLSCDGAVLDTKEGKNTIIYWEFLPISQVSSEMRPIYFSFDTLTVRCRLWRSVGEMSENRQVSARTRIPVEKGSFLWIIKNFINLKSNANYTFKVKSPTNKEELFYLDLLIDSGGSIKLKIRPVCQRMHTSTLQLSILDSVNDRVKCCLARIRGSESKEFTLIYTKTELMEKQNRYLQDGCLNLVGEFSYFSGTPTEEIENAETNSAIENISKDNCFSDSTNDLSSKDAFMDDFKSLLNNSQLSDVKLKARGTTFHGHKCILGVRSPVFHAMFSNDMKENIKDCVDIDDFSDETVLLMLRYIYSADVGELEWGGATELYEAADKYQILKLKKICSSYLKNNLSPKNACEALVLADLHQDEDFKRLVQDYILRYGKDIIPSEEWKQVMETNWKLAAETMCLKFKE